MRRAVLLTVALTLLWIGQPISAPQSSSTASASDLVGTWTLTTLERGASGQSTRIPNPRGMLVFDARGHAFEFVTSLAGQRVVPGTPTPLAEAIATFSGYSGFWGRYSVGADGKAIAFRPEGAISPQMMGGRSFSRTFSIDGDRLTLTSIDEPHAGGGIRSVWERVPIVDGLSPLYRKVVGFWEHTVEKRINAATGATLSETKRQPSVIVYTPTGFVGVHFLPANRKPFAAETPTPEEARAALTGYIGYYGALNVYQGLVFHNILGGTNPTQGTTLRRFVELTSDDEATVRLPPGRNQQGQEQNTVVFLKRLSGVDDMIGRP